MISAESSLRSTKKQKCLANFRYPPEIHVHWSTSSGQNRTKTSTKTKMNHPKVEKTWVGPGHPHLIFSRRGNERGNKTIFLLQPRSTIYCPFFSFWASSFLPLDSILVAARMMRYPQYHCRRVSVRLQAVKKPTTPASCTPPA